MTKGEPDQKFIDFLVEKATKEPFLDTKRKVRFGWGAYSLGVYSFEGLVAEMRKKEAAPFAQKMYLNLYAELGFAYRTQRDNIDSVR